MIFKGKIEVEANFYLEEFLKMVYTNHNVMLHTRL